MLVVIYNKTDGRILRTVECTPNLLPYQYDEELENYLEIYSTVDDSKFYVHESNIIERPTFSESITGTTVSNLPIPTTVVANGVSYLVDDGEAELSFSLPGTYQIKLSSFPYQDKLIEVTKL